MFDKFFLTGQNLFVFYEGITAARITLNNEKIGMLYRNLIISLIRRGTGLSRFQGITYGLWVKRCYTDTLRGQEFYTETIYT